MKVLIDSDVLLDVAMRREPHYLASRAVLDWCAAHPGDGFLAWHTLSNFNYIFSRSQGSGAARAFIVDLLRFVEIGPVATGQAKYAASLPVGDFEDAMQVAAAVSSAADYIVTRNAADYAGAPIPAVTPANIVPLLPP